MNPQPWHTAEVSAVAAALGADPEQGLSSAEARERLARSGPNAIRETPPRPLWRMFLDQFADFMILILIAAAVISGVVGDVGDTVAIAVIVVLNAVVGFVQELRAERAMRALKQLAAPSANVLRGGQRVQLPAAELVPGDVVLLEAGNVVPADLRLIEAARLKIDESPLTGESAPVEKHTAALHDARLPIGDRVNLAFKGTTVTYGRGQAVVVATGMQTELGRIAELLDGSAVLKTPLQQRLAVFGRGLGFAVLGISAVIFGIGLLRGEPAVRMFLTAVSLAVAAIPEALPAVVTILLALGARNMVEQRALVRRLPAVETLGSVTYICSDKTGTMTENRMRVEGAWVDGVFARDLRSVAGGEPWAALLNAMALSNDAAADSSGRVVGDPTETALYAAAQEAGFGKAALESGAPRLLELPFDSERKRMTTFHRAGAAVVAYTKGAPESVLPQCVSALGPAGPGPLNLETLLEASSRLAAEGLRVLAFAQRQWETLPAAEVAAGAEEQLVFVGFVGLLDPPREEARAAVELCQSAGIVPVMITGDHPATALAIARKVGVVGPEAARGAVLTGADLEDLDDGALADVVEHVRIYARVDPAQKIRIVEALQRRGEFVAMTGDGVNDAPALKRADIGVAMGKGGTDVAREAASLVLLDDNFATIVSAVREGRRIFDNIRKFIKYTMTSNSAEIWTIFLAPFLGLPIPLLPIHILWINLLTDGLPGLALAAEPAEEDIMRRPPRHPRESIFAHGMWQHMVWAGLWMGAVSLAAQAWALGAGSTHWQTMVFTVLTLSQMGHVWSIRSERESLFTQGVFSNRPLLGAVLLTFALQMATVYVPLLNGVFYTQPLTLPELGLCLALSSLVFFAVEVEKWMRRRGWIYREPAATA